MIKREYFFCFQVKPPLREKYRKEARCTVYSGFIEHKTLLPEEAAILAENACQLLVDEFEDFNSYDFILVSFNRTK